MYNLIFKSIHGSHLYGLNTPESDQDYKGIFKPTLKELIFQTAKETIKDMTNPTNTKNSKDDIDSDYMSVHKWLNILEGGHTLALELLFTPKEFILESTPDWELIQSYRPKLITKGISASLGYCRGQAAKYGLKGGRLATIEKVLEVLQIYEDRTKGTSGIRLILNDLYDLLKVDLGQMEHVLFHDSYKEEVIKDRQVKVIEVCGKKFMDNCTVSFMIECLERIHKNYGERAEKAKNNQGIDWKAVSHAFRACYHSIELLSDGIITLPMKPEWRKVCAEIKAGKHSYTDVQPELESLMDQVVKAKENSLLDEKVDKKIVEEILLRLYEKEMRI